MADWPVITARLALYADLGLLFGIPLFALYGVRDAAQRAALRIVGTVMVLALALLGLIASLLGFGLQVAAMSGTGLGQIDPAIAQMLLTQTAVGWALLARIAALGLAVAIALLLRRGALQIRALTMCGGVAVSTLVWSGHGAASEGMAGMVHLGGDIVHLLAASAWTGALAMLLVLVSPRGAASSRRVDTAHAALAGFSAIGSVIVGLILVTGLLNGAFIVGADHVLTLGSSPYGRLLLIKLLLFVAMLGCAAANRYWLTPALERARTKGIAGQAMATLRRSVALETMLALLILALVAWLGTLEPPMTM